MVSKFDLYNYLVVSLVTTVLNECRTFLCSVLANHRPQDPHTHYVSSSLKAIGVRPLVNTAPTFCSMTMGQMLMNVLLYLQLKSTNNNLLPVALCAWIAPLLLPLGCFISCMTKMIYNKCFYCSDI